MKISSDNLKNTENEFPKQVGLEKQMKKMGSFVWFLYHLPELWS